MAPPTAGFIAIWLNRWCRRHETETPRQAESDRLVREPPVGDRTRPVGLGPVAAPPSSIRKRTNHVRTGHTLPPWTESFGYDGFSNLLSKSVPSGSSEQPIPTIDPTTNRIYGGGYVYDANGNITQSGSGGTFLGYDMENRITADIANIYAYDPQNHRVARGAFGASSYSTLYFYAPNGQLLTIANVFLSAGQPNSVQILGNRIYFGSTVIGTQTPANQTYGDAGFALNNVGSYSDTYPYGTIIKGSAPSEQTPAFATYSADNSPIGLYYANQRWYSPSMGRFATADPDPNGGNAANPLTLNLYSYSGGDPISQNDPLGTTFGPAGFCPIESWDSGFGDDLWGGTDGILWNCNNQFAGVFVDVGLGVLIGLGIGGSGTGGDGVACFAQLKDRPVNDPRAKVANAVHSFWWVQEDVNGQADQFIVSAGPNPANGSPQWLQEWVTPGSDDGKGDNSADSLLWASKTSAALCGQVYALVQAARLFPPFSIQYNFLGPNSNSAANYVGEAGGFYLQNIPPWVVGYYYPILPLYNVRNRFLTDRVHLE